MGRRILTSLLIPSSTTPEPIGQAPPPFDGGYQVVFERNPTPMWVFDLDTHRFLAVNAAAVAEYGYPPEKFLSLTIRDVYGEGELARFDEGFASGAQELFTGLWVHRRWDGTSLQVEVRSADLSFQDHRARLIHVTNVTARLQAEAARRESEQLLAAIVESSDDAIISKTPDGTVLTWNAAAERMYGYAADDVIGTSIYSIVPPEGRGELATSLQAVRGGVRIMPYETTCVRKDGEKISVSLAISPVVNRAGAVVGLSSIARDITQRKALEDELRQAHKMEAIGRLAGGVAHDFNNLLTAILGYCELLLVDLDPGHPHHADITEIRKAGARAARLTHQLLAFSRKGIIEPTLLDVNRVVTDMRGMLGRLIGDDVKVLVGLQPEPARVMADRGQMEQVVLNLAMNGRDAMPEGGTLTIETAEVALDEHHPERHLSLKRGPYVVLTVTDTGTGMTPEVRARLFEPFFTTKGPDNGTGLGLATVHGIVARSGGSVDVSTEVGRGTSFRVYFPRADATELVVALPPPAVLPYAQARTVLVVEDEAGLRALAKRLLQRQGYTVLAAADAEEALRLFEQTPSIDLVLTDVAMPVVNGPELARRLVERRPTLKVIYMSGYTEEAIVQDGILNPGIAFLHKPFTAETLGRKIREVLDR